jgi:hypothetical protein
MRKKMKKQQPKVLENATTLEDIEGQEQQEEKISKSEWKKLLKEEVDLQLKFEKFIKDPEVAAHHRKIISSGKAKNMFWDYLNGYNLKQIAERHGISYPTVHKFFTDFYLATFDELEIKRVVYDDLSKHANILASFFASVAMLSQDIAFNAILSKRIREELAEILARGGVGEVLEEKKTLSAWRSALRTSEMLLKLVNEQTNIYLNLLERVLDKQREAAFISALYRVMSELDPETAYKLQEALYRDEYARALLEASSTEELIAILSEIFQNKTKIAKTFEDVKAVDKNIFELPE